MIRGASGYQNQISSAGNVSEIDAKKLASVLKEVTAPRVCLTDDSVNYFIDTVNANQKKYQMSNVLLCQVPELYEKHDENTNDVQILYGGNFGEHVVGHYICVFYDASTQRVNVYDSLLEKRLTARQREIISRLYPYRSGIKFITPKTIQTDYTSCGIFSIAYATTLILGKDPQQVRFRLSKNGDRSMHMRKHVKKILESKHLEPFPEASTARQPRGFAK